MPRQRMPVALRSRAATTPVSAGSTSPTGWTDAASNTRSVVLTSAAASWFLQADRLSAATTTVTTKRVGVVLCVYFIAIVFSRPNISWVYSPLAHHPRSSFDRHVGDLN